MPTSKKEKVLFVLLFLSIGAMAQNIVPSLPNAPSETARSNKIFWAVVGIDAGAIVTDDISSQYVYHHGCYESNSWLYGKRPNNARFLRKRICL